MKKYISLVSDRVDRSIIYHFIAYTTDCFNSPVRVIKPHFTGSHDFVQGQQSPQLEFQLCIPRLSILWAQAHGTPYIAFSKNALHNVCKQKLKSCTIKLLKCLIKPTHLSVRTPKAKLTHTKVSFAEYCDATFIIRRKS